MEMIIYTTEMGKAPFSEYLKGIRDKKAKAQVAKALEKIKLGLKGDRKNLKNGLWEYRIDTGKGHRIYYHQNGQELVLLLGGGTKSNQQADIDKARNCLIDYLRQQKEDKPHMHKGDKQ